MLGSFVAVALALFFFFISCCFGATTVTRCVYDEPGCVVDSHRHCVTLRCDDTCQRIDGLNSGNGPLITSVRCVRLDNNSSADPLLATTIYHDALCTSVAEQITEPCAGAGQCQTDAAGAFYTCADNHKPAKPVATNDACTRLPAMLLLQVSLSLLLFK